MQTQNPSANLLASELYLQYLNDYLHETGTITDEEHTQMTVRIRNWSRRKSMEKAPIISD